MWQYTMVKVRITIANLDLQLSCRIYTSAHLHYICTMYAHRGSYMYVLCTDMPNYRCIHPQYNPVHTHMHRCTQMAQICTASAHFCTNVNIHCKIPDLLEDSYWMQYYSVTQHTHTMCTDVNIYTFHKCACTSAYYICAVFMQKCQLNHGHSEHT